MTRVSDDSGARRSGPGGLAVLAAALMGGVLALPAGLAAQEDAAPACRFTAAAEELTQRASPPDSSSVRVDGGVLKICYGSPRMRGRQIMGGLVPFGQPWRLGANEPTTLHVTTPVQVGDARLEPGAYALYAVPGSETWEIFVNAQPERWGIPIDEGVREQDIGSIEVASESVEEAVENLRIELRASEEAAAELVMTWEHTRVTVPIRRPADD